MSVKKAVCLIGTVFLLLIISCNAPEKEQELQLTYNHANQKSNFDAKTQQQYPVRHNIIVNPNVADTDLDTNMSATVTVPVDIAMTVDYTNYTLQYPDIHYEYGSSDPFTVTNHTPDSLTITILTSVNSNYPIEEEQEEEPEPEPEEEDEESEDEETTTDNETIVTTDNDSTIYTDNETWNDNFTYNVISTQAQALVWSDFWDNLSNSDNWSFVSVGHIDNVTFSCDNATVVAQVVTQIQSDNRTNWWTVCDNATWITGGCASSVELSVTTIEDRTGDCQCNVTGDNITTIRPGIRNKNWGGVGDTCAASTQSLEVILKK